ERACARPLRHRLDSDAASQGHRWHQGDRPRSPRRWTIRDTERGNLLRPHVSIGAQHLHLSQPQAGDAARSQAQRIPALRALSRGPGHRSEEWQLSAAHHCCRQRTTEEARLMKRMKLSCALLALCAATAFAQAPDLTQIPPYKKEFDVNGGLRIAGSELKGV